MQAMWTCTNTHRYTHSYYTHTHKKIEEKKHQSHTIKPALPYQQDQMDSKDNKTKDLNK
jgi:ATP adenylyltransferase/5',5'''-P-1,P-4-tetraphosphate phosphorylase II